EDVRLDAYGPSLSDEERAHRTELERLVRDLGLDERVRIGDAVPRADVPSLFASHDALVNNMRARAPDKVGDEAAASCVPVLASNPVFDSLLDPEQRFPRDDVSALAARIGELAGLDGVGRAAIGRALRERVEARHSVETWARGVLAAAGLSA